MSVRNGKVWFIIVILLFNIQIFLNWRILNQKNLKKHKIIPWFDFAF